MRWSEASLTVVTLLREAAVLNSSNKASPEEKEQFEKTTSWEIQV